MHRQGILCSAQSVYNLHTPVRSMRACKVQRLYRKKVGRVLKLSKRLSILGDPGAVSGGGEKS